MKPILYSATETAFTSLGLGVLGDAVSCSVSEELNGLFDLEMTYPIDGKRFGNIDLRTVIKAKVPGYTDPQLFRVYDISTPISGAVTVYAHHITYDLSGLVCQPFAEASVSTAMASLAGMIIPECPFTFSTDKSTTGSFSLTHPISARSVLGGVDGSLLDVYGGEWEFDNFTVALKNRRGADRGTSIRYGKNLVNYEQTRDGENVYTAVYPYYLDQDGNLTELSDKMISTGTFSYNKLLALDLSDKFEETPTEAELRTACQAYIDDNQLAVPDTSWTIEFAELSKTENYKDIAVLERVDMGDTIAVYYPALGVSASSRVVSYVYDSIMERYTSVTLGKVKASISNEIAVVEKEITRRPTQTLTEAISQAIADKVTGVSDGCVRLLDTNGDGSPDTLYIADNADPAQATKVWRWDYRGWAVSSSGYNSESFTMGATLEDGLLAEFVTTAHLTAGTIASADGSTFYLDLENGILRMNASQILLDGDNIGTALTTAQADILTLTSQTSDINNYLYRDADTGVIIIGDTDNPVRMQVKNDSLNIVTGEGANTRTLATFSDRGIVASYIKAEEQMDIGDWSITTGDGFTLKWIGETT